MNVTISRALCLAALCWVVQCSHANGQSLATARITKWEQSANGTGVEFKPLNTSPVSDDAPALSDVTRGGKFEYSIDTQNVRWADDCRCYRYYVFTVRSTVTHRVTRHKFNARPAGSFADQRVQVALTITEDGVTDSDDVSLPVASAPGLEPEPLINVRSQESVGFVSLAGASEIQIVLANSNKQMAVVVPSEITVTSDRSGLWKGTAVVVDGKYPMRLAPGSSETVRVRVEPETWQAIQASFVPTSTDKPHTSFRVKVPYANELFQQRSGSAEITVPIRFRPSIVTIATALSIGVILGSLLLVLTQLGQVKHWPRAAITSLVVSIVLELIGIFMVANNSKFVVFSLDLDPWQTLPVALLGIGTGFAGLEAAKLLKVIKEPTP